MTDAVETMTPEDAAEWAELEREAAEAGEGIAAEVAAATVEDPAAGPETIELLLPVIALACGGLAPGWRITPDEQMQLAGAYAELLDKYWPGGVSEFGPEVTVLIVTAGVFVPRLGHPRFPVRARQAASAADDSADDSASDSADGAADGVAA